LKGKGYDESIRDREESWEGKLEGTIFGKV
jgi:hypothetical protein